MQIFSRLLENLMPLLFCLMWLAQFFPLWKSMDFCKIERAELLINNMVAEHVAANKLYRIDFNVDSYFLYYFWIKSEGLSCLTLHIWDLFYKYLYVEQPSKEPWIIRLYALLGALLNMVKTYFIVKVLKWSWEWDWDYLLCYKAFRRQMLIWRAPYMLVYV